MAGACGACAAVGNRRPDRYGYCLVVDLRFEGAQLEKLWAVLVERLQCDVRVDLEFRAETRHEAGLDGGVRLCRNTDGELFKGAIHERRLSLDVDRNSSAPIGRQIQFVVFALFERRTSAALVISILIHDLQSPTA